MKTNTANKDSVENACNLIHKDGCQAICMFCLNPKDSTR